MTHRQFSRNAASSRAIPVEKMIKMILDEPAEPIHWGKNQKGMQAKEELSEQDRVKAVIYWDAARHNAIASVEYLNKIGNKMLFYIN